MPGVCLCGMLCVVCFVCVCTCSVCVWVCAVCFVCVCDVCPRSVCGVVCDVCLRSVCGMVCVVWCV